MFADGGHNQSKQHCQKWYEQGNKANEKDPFTDRDRKQKSFYIATNDLETKVCYNG